MWKRGRHEADHGRQEADRGPHEADRGPHEADRGPHEAVQEKTKFLGPQFCRSGIGILRKGEFDFVKTLTHEKHCIHISKHVTNYGKIMHMDKKEDKWRKPRSVKGCG
ncbi:conserved hypothetical protein [Trichinella spiralis]|uniref:hypothetical protein n=1 Tax=Trichinella spiralis TaxID=6334 RepID=UPI0001EFDDEE|nr:conserved hypothetical protein [Trichinella spiralis]